MAGTAALGPRAGGKAPRGPGVISMGHNAALSRKAVTCCHRASAMSPAARRRALRPAAAAERCRTHSAAAIERVGFPAGSLRGPSQ